MLRDEVIQLWLCEFRFITFIVTVSSIAKHINENILTEFHTVFYCQFRAEVNCFRIITIYVKHWCINDLCYIRTIDGSTRIIIIGSEPNLVINNKMYGTTGVITWQP